MDIQVTKKQRMFMDSDADELLFGGAAGGGKSHIQIIDAMVTAVKYTGCKQAILRRTFPELERSIIRSALEIYPKELYSYNSSKHTLTWKNKSIIDFAFADTDKDLPKFQSAEYDVIRFDEATHFDPYVYEYLGSRLRGLNPCPKQRKSSTNPGGQGHNFFKERFIDPHQPEEKFFVNGKSRLYIPSKVTDNKFLMAADPGYINRLMELPEAQRKMLLDGSWDIYEGQYFGEFTRSIHVCEPFEVPDHWRMYFTMDYGLDMLAAYWIALDPQEKAYVVREVYQKDLIISEAAKLIKSVTKELGRDVHSFYAPPDLWNRRQETGRSVAEIFYQHGLRLTKTSNARVDGWLAMKEWLKPYHDEQEIVTAKMQFFPSCVNAIRCIPSVQHDPKKHNDIQNNPHEITHAPDAIRGFCISRARPNFKAPQRDDDWYWKAREEEQFNSPDLFDPYQQKESDLFAVYDNGPAWF